MTWQELIAYGLVGLAAGYLAVRHLSRRATGNCCGEKECPAAKQMVEKLERLGRPQATGHKPQAKA